MLCFTNIFFIKIQKNSRKSLIYRQLKPGLNKTGEVQIIITEDLIEKFCRDIGLDVLKINFLPKREYEDDATMIINFLVSLILLKFFYTLLIILF